MIRAIDKGISDQLKYCYECFGSKGEEYLYNTLNKLKIFERYQFRFHKSRYRFDFKIKDYDILLEFHGREHFDKESDYFVSYDNIITRDKKKYELVKKNKYRIIYFTDDVSYQSYENFGYFTTVYKLSDLEKVLKDLGVEIVETQK